MLHLIFNYLFWKMLLREYRTNRPIEYLGRHLNHYYRQIIIGPLQLLILNFHFHMLHSWPLIIIQYFIEDSKDPMRNCWLRNIENWIFAYQISLTLVYWVFIRDRLALEFKLALHPILIFLPPPHDYLFRYEYLNSTNRSTIVCQEGYFKEHPHTLCNRLLWQQLNRLDLSIMAQISIKCAGLDLIFAPFMSFFLTQQLNFNFDHLI